MSETLTDIGGACQGDSPIPVLGCYMRDGIVPLPEWLPKCEAGPTLIGRYKHSLHRVSCCLQLLRPNHLQWAYYYVVGPSRTVHRNPQINNNIACLFVCSYLCLYSYLMFVCLFVYIICWLRWTVLAVPSFGRCMRAVCWMLDILIFVMPTTDERQTNKGISRTG